MFLVDTNVISTTAPTKADRPDAVLDWMERNSSGLYLSVVTVMEVEDGITKARRTGAVRKATELTAWLDSVLHLYGERVLPFDHAAARCAGRLSDLARSRGRSPGFADLAIAGTATHRSLVVVTRNLRRFEPLDVPALDPSAGPLQA